MNKIKKGLLFLLTYFGIYPKQFWANISAFIPYLKEREKFRSALRTSYSDWKFSFYPILTDKSDQSGKARGQYFYQDLHVANLIFQANPKRHIDVGSRIDGFVAHVASYRKLEVMDIRPLNSDIQNVQFLQADLMQPMNAYKTCTDSLSCLHTIEHFGLGRYNDELDVDGHIKGLDSLYELLKPNGIFYFSTQIGPPKIAFNAHRVFEIRYLLQLFEKKYKLISFSYIDDQDNMHENVNLTDQLIEENCGCKLGCGIFVLQKK